MSGKEKNTCGARGCACQKRMPLLQKSHTNSGKPATAWDIIGQLGARVKGCVTVRIRAATTSDNECGIYGTTTMTNTGNKWTRGVKF